MNRWVAGARPRTLGAGAAPVLVGTASAAAEGAVVWWRAAAALVVALGLQVATNYANDYSDGVRGTDDRRAGPRRLTASGLATPTQVRRAAALAFGVAGAAGLALALAVDLRLLLVGAAAMVAGVTYTGGPRPYGYAGLGEVSVLVFFGFVATVGSAYVQRHRILPVAAVAAVPVGLLAAALLVANNLRDVETDRAAGKRTLAVRLGHRRARHLYDACVLGAFAAVTALGVARPPALLALLAAPLGLRAVRLVHAGAPRDAAGALGATAALGAACCGLLAAGLWLS